MAISREEIMIRAGLDYSKVTAGLAAIRNKVEDTRKQFDKISDNAPKLLRGLMQTQLVGLARDALGKLAEYATDVWINAVYGQSDAVAQARMNAAKQLAEFSSASVAQLRKSEADFAKGKGKSDYDRLTDENKIKELEKQKFLVESEIARKSKQAKDVRESADAYLGTKNFSHEERNRTIAESARIRAEVFNLRTEMLSIDKQLSDLRAKNLKLSPRKQATKQVAAPAQPVDAEASAAWASGDYLSAWQIYTAKRQTDWQKHVARVGSFGTKQEPMTVKVEESQPIPVKIVEVRE